MSSVFNKVQKKLGFGLMRLPMLSGDVGGNGKVDTAQVCEMVDKFMAAGFNYFDTAHGYIGGESELAARECLVSRYDRESFVLTNKLTDCYFNSKQEVRPFFESQLERCGVDYFDFYLVHAMNADNYKKYEKCCSFETMAQLKAEGKISHIGISFHDKPEVLEQILTDHPEIEVVQLQFNYIDYNDASIQSKGSYDVCIKHNKPVIVMEPVKGGSLVNLPQQAADILADLGGGSAASYAIRFAASFENNFMVLSGMSNTQQLEDNISYMRDFKPLCDKEFLAISEVCSILSKQDIIPCTACRYCTAGCPQQINIPSLFACMNAKDRYNNWNSSMYYETLTKNGGKASDCIECGKCEKACPQHLEIRRLLKQVSKVFDGKCGGPY